MYKIYPPHPAVEICGEADAHPQCYVQSIIPLAFVKQRLEYAPGSTKIFTLIYHNPAPRRTPKKSSRSQDILVYIDRLFQGYHKVRQDLAGNTTLGGKIRPCQLRKFACTESRALWKIGQQKHKECNLMHYLKKSNGAESSPRSSEADKHITRPGMYIQEKLYRYWGKTYFLLFSRIQNQKQIMRWHC